MGNVAFQIKFDATSMRKTHQYMIELTIRGKLESAIKMAMRKSIKHIRQLIFTKLERGEYAKLSKLTILLRKGQGVTPLIHRRELKRSIKEELVNSFHGKVGLLANNMASSKRATFKKVGPLLHNGGTIKIDLKKFMAFLGAAGVLNPNGPASLKNSGAGLTSMVTIKIPARPFIGSVFENPQTMKDVERIFFETIRKAVRGR